MTGENDRPLFDSIWCINGASYGSLGAGASNSTTRTNPHFKHRSVVCNPVVRVSYGDSSLLLALFESLEWVKNVEWNCSPTQTLRFALQLVNIFFLHILWQEPINKSGYP